jgi:hypothetical protein
MQILDFISLPLHDKIQLLYAEGSFVMSIRYYRFKVNLYLYQDHYVEAFYDPKADRISKIIPLERGISRQKFYADQVRLPAFFDQS